LGELAPYACRPGDSKGRVFAADLSRTRTPFQRDRDRIIHSTAFRRLQYKTQVFIHHEGRHFRTRLTHTLEVSQIARSMARALGLGEDLAEAVALAHDLGHPPFGHAGERVLDEKMSPFGGFDHNIQALRVVTLLENRYAEHDGLNLTRDTLDGILKHNGPLVGRNGQPAGRYRQTGLPFWSAAFAGMAGIDLGTQPSLEAQSAAIADDIAYNAHDIDDAVRAGIITLDALSEVAFVGAILNEVRRLWPKLDPLRQTHEVQRRLITLMIEDAIDATAGNLLEAAPGSLDDVRRAERRLVAFSPRMADNVAGLKAFLFDNVYRSERVMRPVRAGELVVGRLFERLMGDFPLAGRWKRRADASANEAERARVICDFIAGMTDPFAVETYEGLFDDRPDFR